MKRVLAVLALLAVMAGGAFWGGWIWLQARFQEAGPLSQDTVLVIEPGSGLGRIASQLSRVGVVESDLLFRLHARASGFAGQLKAGEYVFEPGVSISEVLAKIVAHDVVVRFVTIPEGLTTPQILAVIDAAEGLTGNSLDGIGAGIGAGIGEGIDEGTLLPETYGYERGESRSALIRRMAVAHEQVVADLWAGRAADLPLDSPSEAVVLASIVEKETALAEERGRVAAVFINRLRRGMRLQSDPTVAYGVDPSGPLGRPLRRSDLNSDTPYNTYKINGLPPGPICHPGQDSLTAVLNPVESKDLYFVADGTGGHAFAETLSQHNRNVARWRRIERSRN